MSGRAAASVPALDRAVNAPAVLAAVFVIATCGLIYELIAGTVASYVLGDSVTQFSTVIGVYLFAMGLGAWVSRLLERNLIARFVEIEIAVALFGGASAAILFLAFAKVTFFRVILYGLVLVIGALVGLEIPLLMRILQGRYDLKELVARVLAVDYLGALLASLVFPLVLVPKLGLVRGAFVVGCLNAAVAVATTRLFFDHFRRPRHAHILTAQGVAAFLLLAAGAISSDRLTTLAEEATFADPIVWSGTSPYQRVVVTQGRAGFQLFINGNLQFASADEHRYHEALVHPAMGLLTETSSRARSVLVLGGGDGLAVRELLRYPEVERVLLVDLDPMMTSLATELPLLVRQNRGALADPRVRVVNADAFIWVNAPERAAERYDLIIADFPDPTSFSLGKLYTTHFYGQLARHLDQDGLLVVQATSPVLARRAFWCVAETLRAAGFFVQAYHAPVTSFGEWGYLLAGKRARAVPRALPPIALKFLTTETLPTLFVLPADMAPVEASPNRLNNQVLVSYYDEEWSQWN